MKPGDTFWPREQVFLLLTPKGRIAKEGGRLAFYGSLADATLGLKPGYHVGAVNIMRVTAIVDYAEAAP